MLLARFCSYSKDVGQSHPHILVSNIEPDNVDITVEARFKLEGEGYGRLGGQTHRAWVYVICW